LLLDTVHLLLETGCCWLLLVLAAVAALLLDLIFVQLEWPLD